MKKELKWTDLDRENDAKCDADFEITECIERFEALKAPTKDTVAQELSNWYDGRIDISPEEAQLEIDKAYAEAYKKYIKEKEGIIRAIKKQLCFLSDCSEEKCDIAWGYVENNRVAIKKQLCLLSNCSKEKCDNAWEHIELEACEYVELEDIVSGFFNLMKFINEYNATK